MAYNVRFATSFRKKYKLLQRRGYNMAKLDAVIAMLSQTGTLPPQYKPHKLSGNHEGKWECHVENDWLLVWEQYEDILLLLFLDTGTHSDIF